MGILAINYLSVQADNFRWKSPQLIIHEPLPPIMIKQSAILLIFIFSANLINGQNNSIKSLMDKTENMDLDMWDLVEYCRKNLQTEKEQANFFYHWIGHNIVYDHQLLIDSNAGIVPDEAFWEKQDSYHVYVNRKAVCAGYAELFKWFMNELDIEVKIITGHIRDYRNHYVELESDDNFRHAWNAVKLDGEWKLLDSTWGTSGESSVSEFYFDIKPELAIITHFPEDSRWQLLENPITLEEFNNSKFINPIWFQSGFSDVPSLKEDSSFYYLVFKSNPNKNWSIQLMYSTDNHNYNFINDTVQIKHDGMTYARFKKSGIPEKAYYKMDLVFIDEENQTSQTVFNVYFFKT